MVDAAAPAPVRRRRTRVVLPGAGGALAALGHPPFEAIWLALPGFALAFVAFDMARSAGPRAAALSGWWTGLGYFGVSLSWIVQPFFVDPVRHGWMAPFAIVLMAGGLALFWGLAAAAAAWIGGGRARALLALALTLSAAELARSYLFGGFPWALAGHVWIGWPAMQLAAFVGPLGLCLLALVVAALAATRRVAGIALAFTLAGAATGLGLWLQDMPVPARPDAPVLRLVQPNVEQHLKWEPDRAAANFGTLMSLSARPADAALGPPDLVIWPEAALPYLLDGDSALMAAMADAAGASLLVGAVRVEGFRAFNSLAEIRPGGQIGAIYDKHHLVPFGEFIPFPWLLERIGLRAFTQREGYGYSAGPGPRVMDLGPLGRALPLICYEAVFPQDLRTEIRPDWLVQVTNDAWFGTFSGPYQHLAQARLRAVETGLPLVRVANTGISAVIDPRGRVTGQLELGTGGTLDLPLPGKLPATLYSRTGDMPAALVLAFAILGLALTRPTKSG